MIPRNPLHGTLSWTISFQINMTIGMTVYLKYVKLDILVIKADLINFHQMYVEETAKT